MTAITFRRLSAADLERVVTIERKAYPIPWSEKMLEGSIVKGEGLGLEVGGELAGYALVSHVVDEAHLLNICVDPGIVRKGYGRQLLRQVISNAKQRGSNVFFLEVRASNRPAIDLYFSEGFNEVGLRPNYYPSENGREDAILMTLELSVDIRA